MPRASIEDTDIFLRDYKTRLFESQKSIENTITSGQLEKICKYLKNPIASGVWILDGVWLEKEGITAEIQEFLVKNKKASSEGLRPLGIVGDLQGMNSTLRLFKLLISEKKTEDALYYERVFQGNGVPSFDNVKDKIKKEYASEIQFFKKNINSPYLSSLRTREFFIIEAGLILFWASAPSDGKRPFTYMSLERAPLEKIAHFFKSIGKLGDYSILPVYSPEEDVIEPYSYYLKIAISKTLEKKKIQSLISQSISTFENRNYAYCINTIGLAFEEQLTQIYETLMRCKSPTPLTIGALLELINKVVRERNPDKDKKSPIFTHDFDNIYQRINNAIDKSNAEPLPDNEFLTILRDMVTLMKENRADIIAQTKSENILGNHVYSIFPTKVIDSMDELLKFRNAISHRSRTSVGSFEATKALFDLFLLCSWWLDEKKLVDWEKNPDDIIRDIVKRNSN